MSNAYALAGVTHILKDLVNDAVVNGDVASGIGTNLTVTALPPDRIGTGGADQQPAQLNIFLHRVTPNAAMRNMDLPTRGRNGERVARPRLALDLHYLVTAYAGQELQAEILLGYAMELFHELAIVPRDVVRTALQGGLGGAGVVLPPPFDRLRASKLADQIELIRITPEALSMDDMSKLWSALQTHYRTTVAYQVSVVLIERDAPARSPLPVLTRGPLVPSRVAPADLAARREEGVIARPTLTYPMLTAAVPPRQQTAVRMGETLTLEGTGLAAAQALVRFTEPRTRRVLDLGPLTDTSATELAITLPDGAPIPPGDAGADAPTNTANWLAGIYRVSIVLPDAQGELTRETNSLPVVVAPAIAVGANTAGAATRFRISCRPPLKPGQQVSLLVGERELLAPEIAPPFAVDLEIEASGFRSGDSWPVRLRVDGIDSILVDREQRPPVFQTMVTIP